MAGAGCAPDYPQKTARRLLLPFEPADLDDFLACRSRSDVYRYLYGAATDRTAAQELLTKKMGQAELTEEGQLLAPAVNEPQTNRVIGDAVLKWVSEKNSQGKFCYVFTPDFGGKGYVTEAAAELPSSASTTSASPDRRGVLPAQRGVVADNGKPGHAKEAHSDIDPLASPIGVVIGSSSSRSRRRASSSRRLAVRRVRVGCVLRGSVRRSTTRVT